MKLKQYLVEAVVGFVGWTVALTPYMIFVVEVGYRQYLLWVFLQLCLVSPIAPFMLRFTEMVKKRVGV